MSSFVNFCKVHSLKFLCESFDLSSSQNLRLKSCHFTNSQNSPSRLSSFCLVFKIIPIQFHLSPRCVTHVEQDKFMHADLCFSIKLDNKQRKQSAKNYKNIHKFPHPLSHNSHERLPNDIQTYLSVFPTQQPHKHANISQSSKVITYLAYFLMYFSTCFSPALPRLKLT